MDAKETAWEVGEQSGWRILAPESMSAELNHQEKRMSLGAWKQTSQAQPHRAIQSEMRDEGREGFL